MKYSEQLQDPRWQKKRLLIFERDGFKCTSCGNDKMQLEVHHLQYHSGLKPWEYSDQWLTTFCTQCHFEATLIQKFSRAQLNKDNLQKLTFILGNCRGDVGKLESVLDTMFRLSTLTIVEIEQVNRMACNEGILKAG